MDVGYLEHCRKRLHAILSQMAPRENRSSCSSRAISALLMCWAALRCTVDDRAVTVAPATPGRDASNGSAPDDRDSGTGLAGGMSAACGAPCELPHASAVCAGSACVIERCVGPFRDADAQPGDGCEQGDIPESGLRLWFMADRGVVAQGGLVSAWIDQSPNGLTAAQPDIAARPGAVPQTDGLPMLSFDGSDDALVLPSGFADLDGASFFAVVMARANPLCEGILHFSNGASGDDVEFGRHQGGVLHYEVGAAQLDGTPEAFVTDRRLVISAVQAGSGSASAAPGTVELRIDGVLDAVGFVELPPAVERRENYVGRNSYVRQPADCSAYFRGLIAEVVFYARGLEAPERERVETYLRAKWQGP